MIVLAILQNNNLLSELSKYRRHLNLSSILLVQYLRDIRSQPSAVIIFKPANGLDYDIIRKEFINKVCLMFNLWS
jgi:hypothetical protein